MEHYWWDYTYEPGTRCVTVRRWRQSGNLFAVIECEYAELTWAEAQDVFDCDSTALLERLLGL